MKLNLKALTLTAGTLWALSFLFTSIANMICTGYGAAFLHVMASLYPGYDAVPSISEVIVGTLYALFDGAIFGFVFGWIYNFIVDRVGGS